MQTDDDRINDEDKQEKIKGGQDGQPPFSAPDDVPGDDDRNEFHPSRDTDIDSDEAYQYGEDEAAADDAAENDGDIEGGARVA
jgi:hypothetical protein